MQFVHDVVIEVAIECKERLQDTEAGFLAISIVSAVLESFLPIWAGTWDACQY